MNILWHMPTLQSRGCGLSRRALCLAEQLHAGGHQIQFAVQSTKTDYSPGALNSRLVLLRDSSPDPIHWSLQSIGRTRSSRHLVHQLPDEHDLFMSCQPEMISAYVESRPTTPTIFVCGGTALLHDAAEIADQSRLSLSRRIGFMIDRRIRRRAERNGFRSATAVIFDSHSTRELVVHQYDLNPHRTFAVYGGVDIDHFQPVNIQERRQARTVLGIDPDELTLVWTGRMAPEKNLGLLIEAVGAISENRPRCLLVGDGPQQSELQSRARMLGLADHFVFCGLQSDVRPYLHAADVFVFPSRGESFGCAIAEAMACGLPCVALKPDGRLIRNASNELIEHGRSGLLADQPTAHHLAGAIIALLKSASLREQLGRAARTRVEAGFTWKSASRQLNGLIHNVFTNVAADVEKSQCLPAFQSGPVKAHSGRPAKSSNLSCARDLAV